MKNKKGIIVILLCIIMTGCKTKTYTITFDTQGGTEIKDLILKEGATIENIEPPTKEGYLFVGWTKDGLEYDEKISINEDIKLTATWVEEPIIPKTYTITYVIDDKIEQTKVVENDIIKEPIIPKKENYRVLGWYVGNELYDFNTKITKDIVLTAKYELNVVTITYDLDGGVGLTLETIPKNSTISIPEPPKKNGYRFLKWTLNGRDFSFNEKIKENITLKAVWELIEYITITFDTNGGDIIENKTIEKYSKIDTLPISTKKGYQFVEWQLDDEKFNQDTIIQSNITLKAVYK